MSTTDQVNENTPTLKWVGKAETHSHHNKKQNKTLSLNYILDQMNLTDTYRTFYPIAFE